MRLLFSIPLVFKLPVPEVWRIPSSFCITGPSWSILYDTYFRKYSICPSVLQQLTVSSMDVFKQPRKRISSLHSTRRLLLLCPVHRDCHPGKPSHLPMYLSLRSGVLTFGTIETSQCLPAQLPPKLKRFLVSRKITLVASRWSVIRNQSIGPSCGASMVEVSILRIAYVILWSLRPVVFTSYIYFFSTFIVPVTTRDTFHFCG